MIQINPEQSETGKKQSPMYHVTAILVSAERLSAILDGLQAAGFADNDIEVFAGPEGAEKLDFQGKHQGVVRRLFRDLVMMLSDEIQLQAQIEEALRKGGVFVSANTHGDETKKNQALAVLKANRGESVSYWGPLAVERP